MQQPNRDSLHLLLLAASAVAASAPLAAQDAAPAPRDPEVMDTVTVTGSRIQKRDFDSASPIVSVGAESIRDTGSNAIEQVLNQLPQFVPSVTTTSNNPSNGGQANIDLRGLGNQRNIVLLDGRRLPPSNATGTVDVNIVPAALLERVEVVTGGASAVYGSDAIAGVANFVMKRDFVGVDLQSGYSQTAERDGDEWNASLTLGSSFAEERGNAVFSLQYTERELVDQGAREFSAATLKIRRSGSTPDGSGTITEGRYDRALSNLYTQVAMDRVFGRYGYAPGVVPAGQNIGFNPDGTLFTIGTNIAGSDSVANFRGDSDAISFNPDFYTYNFAPPNAMQLPLKRWNLAAFTNLDLNESVNVYAQAFLTTYDVTTQLAPVPAAGLTIPITNPFIPADLAELLASRPDPNARFSFRQRMEGVGPRLSTDEYSVYQFLGGVRGDVGESWKWDVYAAVAQMQDANILNNDVSTGRMQELLDSASGGIGSATEAPICEDGYNPFTGPGGVSAACADYMRSYFTNRTQLDHTLAEATFGGKAFSMPAGEAQFSLGASYRKEEFSFDPDIAIARGDSAGFTQQNPLDGTFDSKEFFGELYLPLLSDAPLAKSLGLTLGARLSEHSISGSAEAFKVEGTWQPIDALRMRASFQRAVRAPSISELFLPGNQNFPSLLEDPCNAGSTTRLFGANADVAEGGSGAIRALCIAQGIPVSEIDGFASGATTQIETFGGGNRNLQEESADTFTLGVVFDSPWEGPLARLRASIDYYSIKLDDAIFSIPAGEILLLCYGYAGNNPDLDVTDPACQAVERRVTSDGDPSDGTPWVPSQGTANVSELNTSGLDLQLDWAADIGSAGELRVNLLANWLQKWEITYVPSIAPIDYAGTIGDSIGSALPDYKLFMNTQWNRGPFGLGVRARYLPAMTNKYASYDSETTVGTPSVTYLDATLSWKFSEQSGLRLGVENLADKQPPLYSANVQMNTDPSTFDVLGRRYYLRFNVGF